MSFKKAIRYAALLPVLAAMILFLLAPAHYGKSFLEGVSLWALNVLPVAFPFMLFTALLTQSALFPKLAGLLSPLAGKLFGVSGTGGCAALMAALSGYPVGAKTVLDLYESGKISQAECPRLARLVTTSGPAFLVGTVGGVMFQNAALGSVMLLCHLMGVWLVCYVLHFFEKPLPPANALTPKAYGLYENLSASVLSILCVGGSIALFCLFGEMLTDLLPPLPPMAEALLRGAVEMTAGCNLLSRIPSALTGAGCCFLVTVGGACILFQEAAFLSRAGVRFLPFLAVKLLQGVIAAALFLLFSLFVPFP